MRLYFTWTSCSCCDILFVLFTARFVTRTRCLLGGAAWSLRLSIANRFEDESLILPLCEMQIRIGWDGSLWRFVAFTGADTAFDEMPDGNKTTYSSLRPDDQPYTCGSMQPYFKIQDWNPSLWRCPSGLQGKARAITSLIPFRFMTLPLWLSEMHIQIENQNPKVNRNRTCNRTRQQGPTKIEMDPFLFQKNKL